MRFLPRLLAILVPLLAPVLRAQVHINEFMASNPGRPLDPDAQLDMDGDSSDWIELKSTLGVATNLAGWALSDDPVVPGRWVFPSQNLAANGHLLIYASGKNRAISGVQLHTNFRLSSRGVVWLSRPNGLGGWTLVSQFGAPLSEYPRQRPGVSYGFPSGNPALAPGYFLSDTPGAANGATVVTNFVGDTTFSVDRGFYDSPFTLVVSNRTAGATLVYTLNGSEPSATNGIQVPPPDAFTGPSVSLVISDSTLVRARGIRAGWGPSDLDTQTYIFWDRVRAQNGPLPTTGISATDPAVTVNWGATGGDLRTPAGPDWEVDPDILNTNAASRFVHEDLKSIPSVSLVTNWKGLFGPSTPGSNPADGGMYVGAAAGVANEGADRVFSFEYFNPAGSTNQPNAVKGFHALGKAHVFGGTSQARWKSYKLSFNFKPVEDVQYDVYGAGATATHGAFILDARMNQTWMHPSDSTQRARGDYVRDQVMADLQNAIGGSSFHNRPVHLFLNGMYWGLYSLHERPDAKFQSDYQGGAEEDWDVYKHSLAASTSDGSGVLVSGAALNPAAAFSYTNSTTLANFNQLLGALGVSFSSVFSSKDLRAQANYLPVLDRLDMPDFQRYLLLNFVAANKDWSHKNLYASTLRNDPAARWRFHSWDAEHVFRTGSESSIGFSTNNTGAINGRLGSPQHLHYLLSTNQEYRISFADTAHRHLFNGGALTVAGMRSAFSRRLLEIDQAIRGESARWGDCREFSAPSNTYTRSVHWVAETNRLWNTVIPLSHSSVLTGLRSSNLYPATAAPTFSVFGGAVSNGFPLVITATPGHAIYYTLDGSDPRQAWTSNAVGTPYAGPVSLSLTATVRARARNGTVWSALTEAQFLVGALAAPGNLVVSEIHYNPPGAGDETEFLELLNTSGQTIDLSNVRLDGVDFTFAPATLLGAGQRVLVVKNRSAFEAQYGAGWNVAGEFQNGTGLSNSGETLVLTAANGAVLQAFDYPTPGLSDAGGFSLVRIVPSQGLDATNYLWRVSAAAGGNPGAGDAVVFSGDPHADADGDRLPALVEYLLGTSDADAQSGPPGVTLQVTPSGVLALHTLHPQADDAVLVLEMCESLETGNWQPVPPGLQDPVPGTERCYYRLKATLR